MPVTGEVDISGILANLGDPTHGLKAAKPLVPHESYVYRASLDEIDMHSSVALAVVPTYVWDVNGYYRDLGIPWPYKPTKRQLQQAFLARDGHSSERLTYCMKQLLNKEIREEYDAMPLGSHYTDKYAIEDQMIVLTEEASKRSVVDGKLVTVEDLVQEYEERLGLNRETDDAIEPEPDLPHHNRWEWGYYNLDSRQYNDEPLKRWQSLLVSELSSRGLEIVFSLGFVGGTEKKTDVREHDGRMVFFLQEHTNPTPELAETAVSQYCSLKGTDD